MAAGTSRSPWVQHWIPLIAGLALATALIGFARLHVMIDPETAALGALTRSVYGDGESGRVHCADRRDQDLCLQAYRRAGSPPAVLWLGNSQLHAINRDRPGQETAPMQLHRDLAAKGLYLVAFSQPNANLTEHRFLFRELRSQYDIRVLLLPVCLDDFRETGIRASLTQAPGVAASAATSSLQPRVEAGLEAFLSGHFMTWRDRPGLQNGLNYAAYLLRNRLFGINAQSKRPVSAIAYEEKMTTLEGMLRDADAAGTKVILYAPPYRRDIPNPYVETQYARFLVDLSQLAARHHAAFLDLTDIVPGPEWGRLKDRIFGFEDYDFMHFTAEGHRRLASALNGAF